MQFKANAIYDSLLDSERTKLLKIFSQVPIG